MSKLILGSTLNTEIGQSGGNRAAAESQDATTIVPRLERDARSLWSTWERQLFEPFLRFNVARYGGVMPPIPVGKSEIARERPSDAMVTLLAEKGQLTGDELRNFGGLEARGAAQGGDALIPVDTLPADATIYKADVQAQAADATKPTTPGAAPVADAANVADTAFNGAQVTSLQGMLASVKDGSLSPAAASIAIRVAFPSITAQDAQAMVDAQSSAPKAPAAPTPGGASTAPPFSPSR